jgi:CubicO group peptidase (beta-lactamase class C family)
MMLRRLLAATIVLATVAWPAHSAPPTIDAELATFVQRRDVPGGIVAAAATKDRVIYEGAIGLADTAAARPMTIDALFRIASMTKPVTSVAAMQLYEQHRFALDDRAEKYLPELADLSVIDTFDAATGAYTIHRAKGAVTIRQLFTHTSGFGYGFTSAIVRDFKPRDGDRFAAGPLLFEPGTQWIYGTSVDWLGRLVERLSGQTLEQYFHDHIFVPLHMDDTFYNVPESKQPRLVTRHQRAGGRPDGAVTEIANQPVKPSTTFNGGGGLVSTADDYLRFIRMILNGGTLDGARVLSPETVAMMARNQIGGVGVRAVKTADPAASMDFSFVNDGKDRWGLGFLITTAGVTGKRSPGSLSWGGINNTYFWIDPAKNVGGVILMQFLPFADTKALAAYDTFERGVYRILADRASQ